VRFPAAAPIRTSRAPAVQPGFQNRAGQGQHLDGLPLGSWPTSKAPALQAGSCGSVTRRLHQFHHCGENEIQASLINSASVGATPTPATILGK
jgi:hypothetical protein